MSEKLHELVYYRNEDGPATWNCLDCSEVVHTQVDGAAINWVVKAQEEHVCLVDLAKDRLPGVIEELKDFLKEKGIQIEIHWLTQTTAELAVVDTETRVARCLGVQELG